MEMTKMAAPLEQERKFFEIHQAEWKKAHWGKFALIKREELLGVFDDASTAVEEGAKAFEGESFLVRRIGVREYEVDLPALTWGNSAIAILTIGLKGKPTKTPRRSDLQINPDFVWVNLARSD